jgi:hypothetical protein
MQWVGPGHHKKVVDGGEFALTLVTRCSSIDPMFLGFLGDCSKRRPIDADAGREAKLSILLPLNLGPNQGVMLVTKSSS